MQNTIRNIQYVSDTRAHRWHKGTPTWSLLEWCGAMCGEAGEAANFAKKIKRIDSSLKNIDEGARLDADTDRALYVEKLMMEIADVVLYAVCVANEAGYDLEATIVNVFNEKSMQYGFPERLTRASEPNA